MGAEPIGRSYSHHPIINSAQEMFGLVRDFALGVLVIATLWRGADICWFWPVHFALDMTQFIRYAW
jgi:hypothetical protein